MFESVIEMHGSVLRLRVSVYITTTCTWNVGQCIARRCTKHTGEYPDTDVGFAMLVGVLRDDASYTKNVYLQYR